MAISSDTLAPVLLVAMIYLGRVGLATRPRLRDRADRPDRSCRPPVARPR